MSPPNEQLARIQTQFRRQAEAYERLSSVSDPGGLRRLVALARSRAAKSGCSTSPADPPF